jgi:hypothetical protein
MVILPWNWKVAPVSWPQGKCIVMPHPFLSHLALAPGPGQYLHLLAAVSSWPRTSPPKMTKRHSESTPSWLLL